jgi:Isocitrate/isopropylmalate dehydrogenase
VLWDEVFDRVAEEFPDVETHRLLVDAAAMFLAQEPQRFDVFASNQRPCESDRAAVEHLDDARAPWPTCVERRT